MTEFTGLKSIIDRQLENGKKEEELNIQLAKNLFSERARVRGEVFGKVQGVLFRAFVEREAKKLGLVGWVRNNKDFVEFVAEGDKLSLRKLVIACKKGPPMSRVDKLDYFWEEFTGNFDNFYINYQ